MDAKEEGRRRKEGREGSRREEKEEAEGRRSICLPGPLATPWINHKKL